MILFVVLSVGSDDALFMPRTPEGIAPVWEQLNGIFRPRTLAREHPRRLAE